ncbi:hypothetical protein [Azospirillum isscasi]|uniref:Uncharacterized protein n=1 Tax=Azospirillum isscasi TaxID=3053926 RepID=A0ABU0WEX5_9PROT|nr:hypothetical protein [Azospirillum isscasi]MDQ2102154.1 hypothetical protein [Azospirillum isscasi]
MTIESIIRSVDTTAIKAVLIGQGMAELDAEAACDEGLNDLVIAAENPGTAIVPTKLGDEAIHAIIATPGLCDAMASAVAGPGARFIHEVGGQGDWGASEAIRRARFGEPKRSASAAGCMIVLKLAA